MQWVRRSRHWTVTSPAFIGGAQAVAGGALLSVVSISIIPHAFDEVSGLIAAALVIGFVGGYLLG